MTIDPIAGCGSSVFTDTIARVSLSMLAARMVRDRRELDAIYASKPRDLTADEEKRSDMLEASLSSDRQALRNAVEALTGIPADTLSGLL